MIGVGLLGDMRRSTPFPTHPPFVFAPNSPPSYFWLTATGTTTYGRRLATSSSSPAVVRPALYKRSRESPIESYAARPRHRLILHRSSRPSSIRHTETRHDPVGSPIDVEAAAVVGVVPAAGLVGAHLGRPAAGRPQGPVYVDAEGGRQRRRRSAADAPGRQHPRRGPLAPRRVPLADHAPRRRRRRERGGLLLVGRGGRRHRGEPGRGVVVVAGHRRRPRGRRRAAQAAAAADLRRVLRMHGASPRVARAAVGFAWGIYLFIYMYIYIYLHGVRSRHDGMAGLRRRTYAAFVHVRVIICTRRFMHVHHCTRGFVLCM